MVAKGKKRSGFFKYINNLDDLCKMKSQAKTHQEFSSIDHLELAMSINAGSQLRRTYKLLTESTEPEKIK